MFLEMPNLMRLTFGQGATMMRKTEDKHLKKLLEENARLRRSIDDLLNINELAKIISSTMPVEKILDKVLSFSLKVVKAEQGTISLLDSAETGDPFKTLIRKVDASQVRDKYRLDEDLSGWMLKYRRPLLINDFNQDSPFKGAVERFSHIRSLLSVPLLCKGRLIGVLNLFNKKEHGQFTNDDQRLLSIIASQSAQVIENARLYEEEKQLREIERELETARSIQQGLLPKERPAIQGFEVAGASYPAQEVGGDYFDFIELQNGKWGIALGDISGKGIPAALLMSNLQATLRSQAWTSPGIVDCVTQTNRILCRNTESNKFVTLFYAELEPETRGFRYINAGHNFPLLLTHANEFRSLETGGLVLGMLPDWTFEDELLKLEPGDMVVIYSDGMTEAENDREEQFGVDRLKSLMLENRTLPAQEIIDRLYREVTAFSGPEKQDDDVTVVVVKAV